MALEHIFYTKEVLGINGRTFRIYKVRTMSVDAEEKFDEVYPRLPKNIFGKPINDPRITSVGRFLRRHWLDEIPQLWNLGKGDLKLVGVRAKTEKEWQIYPKEIMEKSLRQKPGLMGVQYANVNQGDFETYLESLEEYLDQWEKDPSGTDKNYFSMIIKNIVLNGVRSS